MNMQKKINCVYRSRDFIQIHSRDDGSVAIMNSADRTIRTIFVNPAEIIDAIKTTVITESASGKIPCNRDIDYNIRIGRQNGDSSAVRNTRIEIYGGGDVAIVILDEEKTNDLIRHLANIRGYFEEMAVK